jgi:hypothetical protein
VAPKRWPLTRRLKLQSPLDVVVGAGDFVGASPLVSALFFDEPAVETLNRIGVESNAVRQPRVRQELGRAAAAAKRRPQAHAGRAGSSPASTMRKHLDNFLPLATVQEASAARMPADRIYEAALPIVLQVLAGRLAAA